MQTIKFDESCAAWTKDKNLNLEFVRRQCEYLMEKCKAIGYIYRNDIYESFGAAWNPDMDNTCYRYSDDFEFELTYRPGALSDIAIEIHG